MVRIYAFPAGFAAAFCTALGFAGAPALARGYFPWLDDNQPQAEPEQVATRAPQAQYRHARKAFGSAKGFSARKSERPAASAPERPLFAVISIADQHVSIYNHQGLVARSAVSTGMAGHPTPKGVFTIIGRERFHASNLYSGAPMPFMQRITWSGIAMHLGVVPGHPASHGCIRLPAGFAARLWGLTRIGERVVISPHEVAPADFAHPLLPAPKMLVQAAEANPPAAAPGTPQPAVDAAQPAQLNPHQFAERLKAKADADLAAALKTVKETSTALAAKQQETAGATGMLRAAEAANAVAQAKADAAAKAFETASATANAKQQEAAGAAAELKAAETDALLKAKAERLNRAYEAAAAARDAAATVKTNTGAALAEAAAKLEAAKTASTAKAAELTEALRRSNEAKASYDVAANAEKEAVRRLAPVSVLVSKKDRRVYVRQGLAPLFDAPASVRDPETPLGSHLYIATAAKEDGVSLKWSVLSMSASGLAEDESEQRQKTASLDEKFGSRLRTRGVPSSAAEALERIEIAQDVLDRIAERLWAGSSLIISDQPLSGETGNAGTDLTVKFR